MMHQTGKAKVLVPCCCLTYPVKSVQCFLLPLRTGRRRLFRIPLGHQPSLQGLRLVVGSRRFVRPLLRYYANVRLLSSAFAGIAAFGLPRPSRHYLTETAETSRFSNIECPHMLRVSDSAGSNCHSLNNVSVRVAFPIFGQGRHPG